MQLEFIFKPYERIFSNVKRHNENPIMFYHNGINQFSTTYNNFLFGSVLRLLTHHIV